MKLPPLVEQRWYVGKIERKCYLCDKPCFNFIRVTRKKLSDLFSTETYDWSVCNGCHKDFKLSETV